MFAGLWAIGPDKVKAAGVTGGPGNLMCRDGLRSCPLFHSATDVDEVIADNAKADPAVHSDLAL